ncbi:MAG: helix-turn-helix transcriptional regulator [Lachnospiraceae bacterium]|nr:helix-turn-helix transcriptional regulator [Lachnospiraceae bacterium]
MTTQYYAMNAKRVFSDANYNTYIHGALHPDRIMQEHDFVYILSGSWDIYQEDTLYSLTAGDVLLLHAGKHHYGLTPCAPGTRTMYIHIGTAADDRTGEAQLSSKPENSDIVSLPTLINCRGNSIVQSLFADIIYALNTKSYGYEVRLNALFSLLLLEMHSSLSVVASEQDEAVEKIIRLFQRNPEKHYTVKQLADYLSISEKTLSRRFLKYCGKTVYAYQYDLKLEAVRQFLTVNPAATLREAALNYGFCDEFHLSKTFKKKFGVSPKFLLK